VTLQNDIEQLVKADSGFIIGFAEIKGLLGERFGTYRYAISIGRRLDDDVIDEVADGPTHQYYKLYKKSNEELAAKVAAISRLLNAHGIKNMPVKPTFEDDELDEEYFKTLRTPFSHKFAATRAGLGWIGKTDLLITKEFGPRLRLASVLVEGNGFEFKVSEPITESECVNCSVCVDKCPAHAANGKLWKAGTDRDEFYDAFKCREKCRELSIKNINTNTSICGICVSVCPIGRMAR
jgi:epoxyqueuosine reductase